MKKKKKHLHRNFGYIGINVKNAQSLEPLGRRGEHRLARGSSFLYTGGGAPRDWRFGSGAR